VQETELQEEKRKFQSDNKADEIKDLEDVIAQLRGQKAECGGKVCRTILPHHRGSLLCLALAGPNSDKFTLLCIRRPRCSAIV
jgi:hypothetical protein